VTLWDQQPASLDDLSTQYYLGEADIGKPRAAACRDKLAELNEYVPVRVLECEELPKNREVLSAYRVVVLTEQSLEDQIVVNEVTHSLGTCCFISGDTFGLFASVFCDFGPAFIVSDQTGEPPLHGLVGAITPEVNKDGSSSVGRVLVTVAEETRHGLESGDFVTFHELKGGLAGLNECAGLEVRVAGPFAFSLALPSTIASNATFQPGSGSFEQVKQPLTLTFKTLAQSLASPDFLISDFAKMERMEQLHAGVQALHRFRAETGQWPRPRNAEDAAVVLQHVKEMLKDTDERIIFELACQARGALSPMTTFLGGFMAQEVLKACSAKFTPLRQHLYFDALEALPLSVGELTEADCQPMGTRYDSQIAVLGRTFHARLEALRVFVVGAGAIGCELLKVLAMLGVGTGADGSIQVTDMDNIEKSNLNRQFLFRPKDVGKPKSQTAADAIAALNPALLGGGHLLAHTERVGPETEGHFGDAFFQPLHLVLNALDNVEARRYMDRRCVYYERALLESGTLGTKGNTQAVIPHLTESYSSSQDPP